MAKKERGLKEAMQEEKVKGSPLWDEDLNKAWDIGDDEEYLGDDGKKKGRQGVRKPLDWRGDHDGNKRKMNFDCGFRMGEETKRRLEVLIYHTRQSLGEVMRLAVHDAYDKFREDMIRYREERAAILQMLEAKGQSGESKSLELASKYHPAQKAAQKRAILGWHRTLAVENSIKRKYFKDKAVEHLTPEQLEKRLKIKEALEKDRARKAKNMRAVRQRRREQRLANALGFAGLEKVQAYEDEDD